MTEVSPSNYWIASNALYITLNANGAPNYIQGNTASGAHILCYVKGVDGLEYDAAHNYHRWPLSLTPTKFNTNTEKYVYVAIPRPNTPDNTAVVVFPSEKLDLYGKNEADQQIGSDLYYYVWLQGIITATNAGQTLDREWQQQVDTGILSSDEAIDAGDNQTWWHYSSVDDAVTFLKEIWLDSQSFFHNLKAKILILAGHELNGVATADTSDEYVDSETLVVTPSYLKSKTEDKFLRKDQDDATPYSLGVGGDLNVGGIFRAITGYITSLFTDLVQSSNYTGDGIGDTGFRLTADDGSGSSSMVVDNLHVRKKATFEEVEVKKETAVAGNEVRSAAANVINRTDYIDAQGEVIGYSVVHVPWVIRKMPLLLQNMFYARMRRLRIVIDSEDVQYIAKVRCYFLAKDGDRDVQNLWQAHDLARCQTFNLTQSKRLTYISSDTQTKLGNIYWWRKVVGVSTQTENIDGKDYHYFDVSMTDCDANSDIPAAGDHVVQFGNDSDEQRMNLIVQEVNGTDAPSVKAYMGIYTYDLTKCWWGGSPRKMMLSPRSGYEFYGPSFKFIQEYGQAPASIDRGVWTKITTKRDDYAPHNQVRKLYYYDKVSHNGCYWLCVMTNVGAHWVADIAFTETVGGTTYTFSAGDYIPNDVYNVLVTNKTNCSRKENYTTDTPSESSTNWKKLVDSGDNMVRLDIDNEMDAVQTDSTGKVTAQYTITTTVRLYDGATEVAINNPTVSGISYTDAQGQQQTLNPTITASGNGKQLSWTFLVGWTLQARYQVNISYTYLNVPYNAVFTITASQGMAIFQLKPSLSAIAFQRDGNNQLTPASKTLGLNIVKIDGGSTADITPATYGVAKIRYSLTEMPALVSSGTAWPSVGDVTVPNTAENVYIALFNAYDILIDRETVPVIKDGENGANGTSPYFADIDNEMDSVACNSSGNTTTAYDTYIGVHVWHGSTDEALTKLQTNSISGFTITPDTTNKRIHIEVANGTQIAEVNTITITVASADSGDKTLHFVLNGVRAGVNGEPATLFELQPSVSSIKCDKNNNVSPSSFSCSVQKVSGSSVSIATSSDGTLRYNIDGDITSSSDGTQLSIGGTISGYTHNNTYITLAFFVGSTLRDKERILIVSDGADGDSALYYVEDYGRASGNTLNNGYPDGFDSTTGWQSVAPSISDTYPYIWKRSRQYNPNTGVYGTTSYSCLTGQKGVNGKDGWMVTANPANVIITQGLGTNASSFTSQAVTFSAKKGGVPATVTGVSATWYQFIGSESGTTVTVSRPSKDSSQNYYTEGYFEASVNVTDPDSGNTVNFTIKVPCYANLLGSWKQSVVDGEEQIAASKIIYTFGASGNNLATIQTDYASKRSSVGDFETFKSNYESGGASINNLNTRVSTAEGNISTVKKQVNDGKNMLSLTNGWEGYQGAAVTYDKKNFGVRNANGSLYSPVFLGVEGETYCFSVYLVSGNQLSGNPGYCYDSDAPTTYISELDVNGTYQSASFIEVTGDTITIGNTTYQRYYFLIPGSVVKERYFTIYNDGNYWFYCPQLEVGNTPSVFAAGSIETTSQIKQTANEIDESVRDDLGETGININGNNKTITLKGEHVVFQNSAGNLITPKISIDPNTGALHAVDGDFSGSVSVGNGGLTCSVNNGNQTIVFEETARGANEIWYGFAATSVVDGLYPGDILSLGGCINTTTGAGYGRLMLEEVAVGNAEAVVLYETELLPGGCIFRKDNTGKILEFGFFDGYGDRLWIHAPKAQWREYSSGLRDGVVYVDTQYGILRVSGYNDSSLPWGGGGSTTLSGLTDVSISSPSNGQVLKYNGTSWVNANESGVTLNEPLASINALNANPQYAGMGLIYESNGWTQSNLKISNGTIYIGSSSITPVTSSTFGTVFSSYCHDNYVNISQFYNDSGYLTSVAFSNLTSHPTSISGYGITDAYISGGTIHLGSNSITPLSNDMGENYLYFTNSAYLKYTLDSILDIACQDDIHIDSDSNVTIEADLDINIESDYQVNITGDDAINITSSSDGIYLNAPLGVDVTGNLSATGFAEIDSYISTGGNVLHKGLDTFYVGWNNNGGINNSRPHIQIGDDWVYLRRHSSSNNSVPRNYFGLDSDGWFVCKFYDSFYFQDSYNNKTILQYDTEDGDILKCYSEFDVDGDCYADSFIQNSDVRLKNIISDLNLNIYNVANAPIFRYTWKDGKDNQALHVGTSAQYWQTVLPETVSEKKDGMLAMQYDVVALAAAVITAKTVASHEDRITILERENDALKNRIKELENNIFNN